MFPNLACHFDKRSGDLLIPDLAARVTLMDKDNQVIARYGVGPDDYRKRRVMNRENFTPGKLGPTTSLRKAWGSPRSRQSRHVIPRRYRCSGPLTVP